ncbi:hypothetical protein C8R43DRAFT_713464 [Mycena crocata]|nr:hypothetical protein C8R43DRAFT_713464 [Mycena crocata]
MTTTLFALPGELIIDIFKILTVDEGDIPSSSEPLVLRLCSVCKFLREFVINTPTLWTTIRLGSFRDLDTAPLFVKRSTTCLLEIFAYFDRIDHLPPELVREYGVERWRKLTVRGPMESEVVRFVQSISDIPMPDLKEVRLLPRERSSCNNEHVPLLSGAADALNTLTMHGCIRCLAPLPHLTRLNVSRLGCQYDDFRCLIQGSPNLATLILDELQDDYQPISEPVTTPRPLIEALSLRSLAVGFTGSAPFDRRPLLAYLSTPNLEYLEIAGSRADSGDFSGKPFPALRTLCLSDMSFPTSDVALYRSLSKITHLEINNVQGVEILTLPDKQGVGPWPDLKTLVCRFPDEESCSWLEKLVDRRPRLSIRVPEQRRDDVLAIQNAHDVRFLSDDGPSGLLRTEDFAQAEGEDDDDDWDSEDSDFYEHDLDEAYFLEENYDWDGPEAMEDEVDDYDYDEYDDWMP